MMEDDRELARLRDAFLEEVSRSAPQGDDPSPETMWKAVNGRLSAEETRSILDRAIASPSCAYAWILAHRMSSSGEPVPGPAARRPALRRYGLPALAAGMLLAASLVAWYATWRPAEPVYRGGSGDVVSLVPDGTPIPRDSFTIDWEPAEDAEAYNVRVLRSDFTVLQVEEGLTRPGFTVSGEILEGIRDGEEVHWQVEIVFSDGSTSLSRLFRAMVTDSPDEGP